MDVLNQKQINFINHVKEECLKYNVTFLLINESGILFKDSGSLCNGYFIDSPCPTLAVATGKDVNDWFLVLIHEFAHMQQWIEQDICWTNNVSNFEYLNLRNRLFNEYSQLEASDLIDLWLDYKIELSSKELDIIFNINILLESDCEKRAYKMIDDYDLEINKNEYAQKANAYILFYQLIKQKRKWYKIGHEPYSVKTIWEKMPTHFNIDYLQPQPKYFKILKQCL